VENRWIAKLRCIMRCTFSTDDPDLAFLVEHWPLLSEPVRNEIVALAAAGTVK
jgi:hypothetical protein